MPRNPVLAAASSDVTLAATLARMTVGAGADRMPWHRRPVLLWTAFFAVHLVLGWICLVAPSLPMGDVTLAYRPWVMVGVEHGIWLGIDEPWVYPALAMLPMLGSLALGTELYASTWLTLATLADLVAFAVLVHGRRATGAAWWWLAFLLALGPVVLGRIDVFATAAALVGALVVLRHPVIGSALLTIGAWIKAWPAALVGAALLALRTRLQVALGAASTTLAVLVAGVALGGGAGIFGFVAQQAGRGLQIESPLAVVAMWSAWAGGPNQVYYDHDILTYQLRGAGVELAAGLSTPLLAVAVLAIVVLGVIGAVRRAAAVRLLPALALALTSALILFNKVGSPQFAGWLAVPVVLGLVAAAQGTGGGAPERGADWWMPAALSLAIAALTHAVYPYAYGLLLRLDTVVLAVLTLRNALYAVLFAWAVVALVRAVRGPRG